MGCNAFRASLVNPAGMKGTSIIFGETDITDCNVQHVALDIFPECGTVDGILGCQIRCVRRCPPWHIFVLLCELLAIYVP